MEGVREEESLCVHANMAGIHFNSKHFASNDFVSVKRLVNSCLNTNMQHKTKILKVIFRLFIVIYYYDYKNPH